MTDYYTENLAEFGYREIEMLNKLLTAWLNNGLPEDFCNSLVKPALNRNSGYVFLVNDEYQVAMLNEDKLELFYTLPYSGIEGFLSDLIAENEVYSLHSEDIEYIESATAFAGINL